MASGASACACAGVGSGHDAGSGAGAGAAVDDSELLTIRAMTAAKAEHFQPLKALGTGQNGVVLECRCSLPGVPGGKDRVFAVKIMFNFGIAYAQGFHVFEAEYAVLAALPPHPNIATYLAQFRSRVPDSMMPYLPDFVRQQATTDARGRARRRPLAAQFVVGHRYADTLEAAVSQALDATPEPSSARGDAPPLILPLAQWTSLARDVCRAVLHMEQHRVVHRDMKLDNVFVTEDGRAVIGDFGCALRLAGGGAPAGDAGDAAGAEALRVMFVPGLAGASPGGNQAHLAPEVLSAWSRAHVSPTGTHTLDYTGQPVFAAAVVLFELVSGEHPMPNYPSEYQAGPGGAVNYTDDDVLPPPAQLPEVVRRRLSQALRCDPGQRCSLTELLEALEAPVPGVDDGGVSAAEAAVLRAALASARARATAAKARAAALEAAKTEAEARASSAEARASSAEARASSAEARASSAEAQAAALDAGKTKAEAQAAALKSGKTEAEARAAAAAAGAADLARRKVEEGGGGDGVSTGRHFRGSAILPRVAAGSVAGTAVDGRAALLDWLPAPHYTPAGHTWTLRYSGERDGWAVGDFHAACDGRGPTLVLMLGVAMDDGRAFVAGGYAAASWSSDKRGKYVADPEPARAEGRGSFLFSLVDGAGHGPVQLRLKDPARYKAQLHAECYGPRFGHADIAVGVQEDNTLNSVGNSLTFTSLSGSSYDTTAAAAQGCTTFRGPGHPEADDGYLFTTKALEVFELR